MIGKNELKELIGKKVKDFAVINDNFSIVFEDDKVLKFIDNPYELGKVEDMMILSPSPTLPRRLRAS